MAAHGEEDGVIGTCPPGLELRVHVVRARGGLERDDGVAGVPPDGRCHEREPVLQPGGGGRGHGPRLDDHGGHEVLRRRGQQPARGPRPAGAGDPHGRIAVRAVQAFGRQQVRDALRQLGLDAVRELDRQPVRGPAEALRVLGELRGATALGAQGLEDAVAQLEAAVEDGQVGALGRTDGAVHPDEAGRGVAHRRPLAVSHGPAGRLTRRHSRGPAMARLIGGPPGRSPPRAPPGTPAVRGPSPRSRPTRPGDRSGA